MALSLPPEEHSSAVEDPQSQMAIEAAAGTGRPETAPAASLKKAAPKLEPIDYETLLHMKVFEDCTNMVHIPEIQKKCLGISRNGTATNLARVYIENGMTRAAEARKRRQIDALEKWKSDKAEQDRLEAEDALLSAKVGVRRMDSGRDRPGTAPTAAKKKPLGPPPMLEKDYMKYNK